VNREVQTQQTSKNNANSNNIMDRTTTIVERRSRVLRAIVLQLAATTSHRKNFSMNVLMTFVIITKLKVIIRMTTQWNHMISKIENINFDFSKGEDIVTNAAHIIICDFFRR
jgi:hypothetical protein